MRNFAACVSGLALLSLAGSGELLTTGQGGRSGEAPAWIPLPATPGPVSYLSGSLDAGLFELRLGQAPAASFQAVKTKLALQGFEVKDAGTSVDRFAGASAVAEAIHPASGRRLHVAAYETPEGGLLRVHFASPPPRYARF